MENKNNVMTKKIQELKQDIKESNIQINKYKKRISILGFVADKTSQIDGVYLDFINKELKINQLMLDIFQEDVIKKLLNIEKLKVMVENV